MHTPARKSPSDGRRPVHRGVTLVELLVTISIMMVLMAVASQMVRLSVDDRRTREASRAINVYLASVRNRAMELGRPCGVLLRRLDNQPECVVALDQVEVPPPYAGDSLDAAAQLELLLPTGSPARVKATLLGGFNETLVSPDDLVQFNHQGPFYQIVSVTPTELTLELDIRQGQMLPWPTGNSSAPMPYQIIRRPKKSAANTLQLPARAVIDLMASGNDHHSIGDDAIPGSVYIMFSPNGSLDRVYHGGNSHPGSETIYLLIGKRERVPAGSAEDTLANWQDPKNLWVTISAQTGLVTTSEVAQVDRSLTKEEQIFQAREFARDAQSMGGR